MKKTILYHVTVKATHREWVGRFLEQPTMENISHAILEDILPLQAEADAGNEEDADYLEGKVSELRILREVIEVADAFGDIIVAGCKVGTIEMEELQAFSVDSA